MTSTVRVALKMPHGIVLRLFEMVEHDEPVMGGGTKSVKTAVLRTDVDSVRLNGTAKSWDQPYPQDEFGNPVLLVGGFAITPNVDQEFFEEWLEQNQGLDLVRNGLIFSMPDRDDGKARERSGLRTGMEPLNTKRGADPRMPVRVTDMNAKDARAD